MPGLGLCRAFVTANPAGTGQGLAPASVTAGDRGIPVDLTQKTLLCLEMCVQKTGATKVGIPPWEEGGKGLPAPISHGLSGARAADPDFLQDLQASA